MMRTSIMGILNVTPDSFSDGGKYLDPDRAVEQAKKMVEEGADMIDVGGESSRPGSVRISAEEECSRIMPVIRALKKGINVPISVDTYKSEVASMVLSEGVSVINDITALHGDENMAQVISNFDAGVILMHMKGEPGTMQDAPYYDDIMREIVLYLGESISIAEHAGISPDKIVVDPGIGFGKGVDHNLTILKNLNDLGQLNKPVLVGVSRKSFIGALTDKEADKRVFGTAAGVAAAVLRGADIIRVHDVGAMKDVASVVDAIKKHNG